MATQEYIAGSRGFPGAHNHRVYVQGVDQRCPVGDKGNIAAAVIGDQSPVGALLQTRVQVQSQLFAKQEIQAQLGISLLFRKLQADAILQ